MPEILDIVSDDDSKTVGRAERSVCHGDPSLIHRAVRVVVRHPSDGRILLQKRSASKQVQPGKWDAAVGGHPEAGEDCAAAAKRELAEELGIVDPPELKPFYTIRVRNGFESENIRVYTMKCAGPFRIQKEELDEIRFFTPEELARMLAETPGVFTPLLRRELAGHILVKSP